MQIPFGGQLSVIHGVLNEDGSITGRKPEAEAEIRGFLSPVTSVIEDKAFPYNVSVYVEGVDGRDHVTISAIHRIQVDMAPKKEGWLWWKSDESRSKFFARVCDKVNELKLKLDQGL